MARASFTLFLLMGLVAVPLASSSHAVTPTDPLSSHWLASKTVTVDSPRGPLQTKILQRFVTGVDKPFAIGNIVFLKFPKPTPPSAKPKDGRAAAFDPDHIANTLRAALGVQAFKKRRFKDAWVYEGEWKKAQRYVRIYIREKAQWISYSVALFRVAYGESVLIETEILQRQLAEVVNEDIPWLKKLISAAPSLVRSAYAEGECQECGSDWSCLLQNTNCNLGNLVNIVNGLRSDVQNAQGTVNGVSGQLNTANGTAREALEQVRRANGTASTAIDRIRDVNATAQDAIGTVRDTTNRIDQRWGESLDVVRNLTRIAEQVADPSHALLWAGASAAGASLGVMAVNVLVDGIVAGGRALWELISGQADERRMLEIFRQAREEYEKSTDKLTQLEQALDGSLYFLEQGRQFGRTREQLLAYFGPQAEMLHSEYEAVHQREVDAHRLGLRECYHELSVLSFNAHQMWNHVQAIRDRVDRFNPVQICGRIRDDLRRLAQAEGTLQHARARILAGRRSWYRAFDRERGETFEHIQRAQDETDDVRTESIRFANQIYDRAMAHLDPPRRDFITRCADNTSLFGVTLGDSPAEDRQCEAQFYATPDGQYYLHQRLQAETARDSAIAQAQSDQNFFVRAGTRIQVNPEIYDRELTAYNGWFRKVGEEQACLNDDTQCSEGAPHVLRNLRRLDRRVEAACPLR